jgi:tRNA(His) 5'-end guanylyltransferase
MTFDDLDRELRRYETVHDFRVPPGVFMVARLDGRSFTRLTKEVLDLEAPFDPGFHALMVETVAHLMACGFRVLYGYTQSDEISLLLHPDETAFERKLRKYNSILAGEASARLSLGLARAVVFDCRISQLPTEEKVVDYFRWRQEDARRNALNACCYWKLREGGRSARQAARELAGRSSEEKLKLLSDHGVVFRELPAWQRLGTGLTWERYEKEGIDPRTGAATVAERRRLRVDEELPEGEPYGAWIAGVLRECAGITPRRP